MQLTAQTGKYELRDLKGEVSRLLRVQNLHHAARLTLNLLLQQRDGIKQLLRAGRTSRHIHVDRNHLVYTLDNGVIVEYSAGSCASAHGDNPLRLWYLHVESPNYWCHLLRNPS